MKLLEVVAEWLQKVILWICFYKELPGPSVLLVLPQWGFHTQPALYLGPKALVFLQGQIF